MAKELFAKRKAKFVDSMSKTSSSSLGEQQPPTFLLASTVDQQDASSSSSSSSSSVPSSNHSEINSEIILPVQQDKEYGIQLDDEQDQDDLRTTRSYQDDHDDFVFGSDPPLTRQYPSQQPVSSPSAKSADLLTAHQTF